MANKQLKIFYIFGAIIIVSIVIASIILFSPMSSLDFCLFVVIPIIFYGGMAAPVFI